MPYTGNLLQQYMVIMPHAGNPTTIVIYMKAFKAEINSQAGNGNYDIGTMPFGRGRYELPTAHSRKMALTKEQVTIIACYKGNPTLEKYRDLWLLFMSLQ